jgi:hypothetical protein
MNAYFKTVDLCRDVINDAEEAFSLSVLFVF